MLLLVVLACARLDDELAPEPDADGDGWTAAEGDCDDADALRFPGRVELCNLVDDDCDGLVDEGVGVTGYFDGDGDGHGVASPTSRACTLLPGYAALDGDCDDDDAAVHPGAIEACNGLDDDCDGATDDEDDELDTSTATTYYQDADADGYGAEPVLACDQPAGTSTLRGDCDDSDPAFNPGAPEACDDPTDYNCDGSVGFADADLDGWPACLECRDDDPAINPGATEACNGLDDDCDGDIDDRDDSLDLATAATWYADDDGDGFGGETTLACDTPVGHVAEGGDCDDTDARVNPAATETCNGIDDDCDGDIDSTSSDAPSWYADADGDGHGDAARVTSDCDAPPGTVASDDDCDDTDATVSPSARETCNAVDDDCDGAVDSGENGLGGAWSDDFEDNDIADWTALGGGWSVSAGVVTGYSTSHIGPDLVRSTPMDGSEDTYTMVVRAMGNHDMGLVLAYANSADYCGFHLLQGLDLYLTTGNNVEAVVGTAAYDALTWYELRAELSPEHVDLYLDGTLLYSDDASCDDFVRTGAIGLQVHQDHLAYFDGVCVEW